MVAVTPVRLGEPAGRLLRSAFHVWLGEAPERPKPIQSTYGFPDTCDASPRCARRAVVVVYDGVFKRGRHGINGSAAGRPDVICSQKSLPALLILWAVQEPRPTDPKRRTQHDARARARIRASYGYASPGRRR